ncbi:MAG: DUF4129 domain-containing protein [Candidatus Eremiobacteraeota bacterium]|nr:DUF4129 domain-containing protein [Candidatus Eremiobacteraeota bacterium]
MIAAVLAAVALTMPSREALIERWLHANRAHAVAQLALPAHGSVPPLDLDGLAQRELATAGRYRLMQPGVPPAESEPWWLRALEWIGAGWRQLWRAFFGRVHVSPQAASGIGEALLALVALTFVFIVWRILRNVQLSRSAARSTAEPLEALADPRSLYQSACEAADRGEYGNAALLLFAATVALLDRRGAVTVNRSATVGELRRKLRAANADLVAPFDAVAAPFIQKAYAERPIDAAQWRHARSSFDRAMLSLSKHD